MSNPSGSNWTTNVNRSKTKRWVEAKSYSYDGDDWGDVDEYGEYDEPKPAPQPAGLRKATAPASMTGPTQSPISDGERTNSFTQEDERRTFSGPTRTAYAQSQPPRAQPGLSQQPQTSQTSQWPQNTSQFSNDIRNPTTIANAPYDGRSASMTSNNNPPAGIAGRRKPSIDQSGSTMMPIVTDVEPPPAVGGLEKPSTPTIIRPADIYRRMQEEREKERLSQESSRPSLSGLTRDESPAGKSDNSGRQIQGASSLAAPQPLNPHTDVLRSKGPSYSPVLPEISGLSGFGEDFGGSFLSAPTSQLSKVISADAIDHTDSTSQSADTTTFTANQKGKPSEPSLQHQPSLGYKSVVNQAFDQAVPPTPSSVSGSGVDRSNSDSTSNISPILSRDISSATRQDAVSNIPSITEEPNELSRPTTATTESRGAKQSESVEHSSFKPGHRRDKSIPSAGNSPARTPAVEASKQLVASQEAEITVTTPISATISPHTRDGSSSPTKNRVRNLVDKIDSTGKGDRGTPPLSPDNADSQRPSVATKESFRPNIPGSWTSYTTNPPPRQIPDSNANQSTEPQIKIPDDQPAETKEDQFAKAAAAGSALAGALIAAAGLPAGSDPSQDSEARKPANRTGTAFHPEATRLVLPRQDSDAPSSIMPTPLDMKPGGNQQPEYFGSSAIADQETVAHSGPSLHVPQAQDRAAADNLSTHSSPTDLESDRLRKEIVRELSPQRDFGKQQQQQQSEVPESRNEGPSSYSAIYDSYMDEDEAKDYNNKAAAKSSALQDPVPQLKPYADSSPPMFSSTSGPLEDVPEGPTISESSHSLKRQFSWETPLENLGTSQNRVDQIEDPTSTPRPQDNLLATAKPTAIAVDSNDAETSSHAPRTHTEKPPPPPPETSTISNMMSSGPEQTSPTQMDHRAATDHVLPLQSQTKVPAFREIMAIQSTPQRIQVYDQTRETFAKMDTGLVQWIQATITSLPEHEELLRNGGSFPPVLRAAAPTGVQGNQGVSHASRPSFGPSSSKTVKGKDLLHSTGVFGGKASSAAKGLFAKGRSKWGRSSDKAYKRSRGRSINQNGDSPSKPYYQQENTWETDVSAPYFSSQALSRQGVPQGLAAGLPESAVPQGKQPDDLPPVDSAPSNSVSPPTTAAQDSPTLGRSNTTTGASGVSPLSGRTSFERKRASLAQKRASMEVPSSTRARGHRHSSSVDSHRYGPKSIRNAEEKPVISTELQARLTVHQNQMRSFGEEFPAGLIIPAEYRIPSETEKASPKANDSSAEKTPTQADFPKEIMEDRTKTTSPLHTEEIKKAERKATPSALWLDTTGTIQDHTFDGPASPDYALRKEEESAKDDKDVKSPTEKRPGTHKHVSSFSFIQFDPMPSADLTLKDPVTPKRRSFSRDRVDTSTSSHHETEASESSFADYPAAEDFGALGTEPSVSTPPDVDRVASSSSQPMQDQTRPDQLSHQMSHDSESANSRSSMPGLANKRLSRQLGDNALDSPTIPKHESYQVREGNQRDPANAFKRHSMLSDVRESRELYPDGKDSRKQNRKSLLGLGLSMRPPTAESLPTKATKVPKFTLIPSIRKRTETDLSKYEADVSRPSLTIDKNPLNITRSATAVLEGDRTNLNSGVTENMGFHGEKAKKRRFSGLSSFINKAKPRMVAVGNAARGRSPTSLATIVDSKPDSVPPQQELERPNRSKQDLPLPFPSRPSPPVRSSSQGNDESSVVEDDTDTSKDQLVIPKAHIRNASSIPDINSNQDAVVNKITAPPQHGPDYKSVYPPEFFGEQPPQGYYSPEDTPNIVINAVPEAKDSATKLVQSNASVEAQVLPETRKEQTRSNQTRPPPLPLKELPKHSATATAATEVLHANQGPPNTILDLVTPISLEDDYIRSSGKKRNPRITDSIISSLDTPSVSSPVMHTATTRIYTRINDRAVSPNPVEQNRSSIPMIAPLKIAKKSPVLGDKRDEDDLDSASEQDFAATEVPQQKAATPQLTLNTRTGSNRPTPFEQFSNGSTTIKQSASPQASNPTKRNLHHPFVPKRTSSNSAVPTIGLLAKSKDRSGARSAEPVVSKDSDEAKALGYLDNLSVERDPISAALDDPVLVVQPLTIRKSPEIGMKKSPILGTLEDPDRPAQAIVESNDKESPAKSSPFGPNRDSLHSPALKDSPTLPRTNLLLTKLERTLTHNKPTTQSTTTDQTTTSEQAAPEKTNEEIPSSDTEPTVHRPGTMTPVEKMKDEPRVKETVKESEESEDEIVMSSTAYPGQEWRPDYGYGGWDGYE